MSFWDNVKKFTQPYSDDEYEDYDEEEMDDFGDELDEPAPRSRRAPAFGSSASGSAAMDFGSVAAAAPAATATPAAPVNYGGTVTSASGNKQEVVLYHAKAFDDAAKAADELRSRRAIILNMENVDKAMARRVVDFLSGCVYALDGDVKKIAQSAYLFCPHNMDIVGDLETLQAEVESYI